MFTFKYIYYHKLMDKELVINEWIIELVLMNTNIWNWED